MNSDLKIDWNEAITFISSVPQKIEWPLMPQAVVSYAQGAWGMICLQEVRTEKYLLRNFIFALRDNLSFRSKEKNEGLQSLLSIKGDLEYHVQNLEPFSVKEKEFVLFDAKDEETLFTLPGGKTCSILNAYYSPLAYSELSNFFPSFKGDLKKAYSQCFAFLFPPKIARYTIHDSIEAIWYDKYVASLQLKHIEIRIESSFFTMLAQAYTPSQLVTPTPFEHQKSVEAYNLILKDLTEHYTLKQIATTLEVSPGWLKKSFGKVYGTGMFHLLRRERMNKARQMLLHGESLKVAALEVGMQPSNFPKEFKSFFGYTVTELKKGRN